MNQSIKYKDKTAKKYNIIESQSNCSDTRPNQFLLSIRLLYFATITSKFIANMSMLPHEQMYGFISQRNQANP